jgi:putative glycosyltransferase
MNLSIVSTLYQSAPYISKFYARATAVAKQLSGDDYEIILVHDGSPDESLRLAVSLTESDPRVVVVDLSRNFGHHRAMMTGLMHSKGQQVFLIDCDLEEEPEWLLPFNQKMKELTADVVYGVQAHRKGGRFERWSGFLFYRLFNMLSGLQLPENLITARLMTRRYVNALMLHQEREVVIAGLWVITGYMQCPYPVRKHSASETTYSIQHRISHLVNSITSFTNAPLVGIFYAGLIISTVALLYTLYLISNWLFLTTPLSGWTSVMASIWLLGGMIISFVGVVGIYIAKIFAETKHRPYTIVRHIYGR